MTSIRADRRLAEIAETILPYPSAIFHGPNMTLLKACWK